jgi:hypothetical protein
MSQPRKDLIDLSLTLGKLERTPQALPLKVDYSQYYGCCPDHKSYADMEQDKEPDFLDDDVVECKFADLEELPFYK